MKPRCLRLFTLAMVLAFTSQAHALNAPAALVPAGLLPGDTFYIIFVTSTTIPGNQSVANYNTHVNTAAALAASTGAVTGWRAWLAHDDGTVQTSTLFAADTTRPVYNTKGLKLANDRADLLDGTLINAVEFDESGVSRGAAFVYTGADSLGNSMSVGDDTLGGNDAATDGCGYTRANIASMGLGGLAGGNGCPTPYSLYAVSPLLTVPAAAPAASAHAIPTLSSWGLLALSGILGLFALAVLRKKVF